MSDEDWRAAMVAKGHAPRLNEDGKIDMWGLEYEYHNGPICETCHKSWCKHCDGPEVIKQCESPVIEVTATRIIGRLA